MGCGSTLRRMGRNGILIQVNRNQFLEQGYVILRDVIPPELLDDVRAAYEKAVDRQRTL